MGGTSYENNQFKLISRNNSSQNQKFIINNIGIRDNTQSPPLKPIEEFIGKREKQQQPIINSSVTHGGKFYIPQNNTTKIIAQKYRNVKNAIDINDQNSLKSYNITQEKFFPQKQNNVNRTVIIDNHPQKGNKQKVANNECKMSLEFLNQSYTQIKKCSIKHHQQEQDMIREEQYEEISEDETNNKRMTKQNYQQKILEQNNSQESIHETDLSFANLSQNQERPTNRLGCSRAFHSNKEDWKGNNNMNCQPYSNISIPRNNYNILNENDSSKSTISATSLNMIKPQSIVGNSTFTNGNSISPKPGKWANKESSVFFNSNINTTQKIQEIQKEVNLMYLGGIANPKKKVGAGIKLNPINRGNSSNYTLDQSYAN